MKLLLVISFLVFHIVISRMDAKPVEGVPLNEEVNILPFIVYAFIQTTRQFFYCDV